MRTPAITMDDISKKVKQMPMKRVYNEIVNEAPMHDTHEEIRVWSIMLKRPKTPSTWLWTTSLQYLCRRVPDSFKHGTN